MGDLKKYPWVIDKGIVSKRIYIFYFPNVCVPLKFGSGTRIKIIEALSLGTIVISSKKGIEGINLKKTNPPLSLTVINFINKILMSSKIIKNLKVNPIIKNFM